MSFIFNLLFLLHFSFIFFLLLKKKSDPRQAKKTVDCIIHVIHHPIGSKNIIQEEAIIIIIVTHSISKAMEYLCIYLIVS